ncbi:MAG TPA: cyclic nucleotide-binding domain-containing protein [Candidatus Sulfotelmatobacter sp.]|jgi:CRP-like cAMP-binding protein|nr:cyclic nucleotide-binding domain-containing protein [Candidatus Sulfotelmatobacter sp.]
MAGENDRKPVAPERRSFPKGSSIFKQGDTADAAYIVESGAISIFKTISGKRIALGSVGPRGIFGELALLDPSPRMASAVASEDAVCAVITKDSMDQMLESAPPGLLVLMRSMAQTIRSAGEELADARFQLQELTRQEAG